MISYIKQVLVFLFVMVLIFAVHFFLLKSMGGLRSLESGGFPLYELYIFQFVLSLVVFIGVRFSVRLYPHYVGFVFLGLLTLKFVLSYLYIRGGLVGPENDFLRYNYLMVVILFLFGDVGLAYKALNKSDER